MRRDMDLIRKMLKDVANAPGRVDARVWEDNRYTHEVVGYHVRLLDESGLANVSLSAADNDSYFSAFVDSLTWYGCDYLDAISSDDIWRKVKLELVKVGGGATAAIVQQVACKMVTTQLGL